MCAACLEAGLEIAVLLDRTWRVLPPMKTDRRVRRHRLFHVGDMRQRFVADPDQASGVIGALFGVGGDGGDLFALEHAPRRRLSFQAIAAFTPGAFCASVRSIDTTRACGSGERTIRP